MMFFILMCVYIETERKHVHVGILPGKSDQMSIYRNPQGFGQGSARAQGTLTSLSVCDSQNIYSPG